jgi:hypothetical protein
MNNSKRKGGRITFRLGLDVPDAQRAVPGARHDAATIRGQGDRRDPTHCCRTTAEPLPNRVI